VPDNAYPAPILRTKLHRPAVTPDVVRRERLPARLDAGREPPLSLVSAPAGYCKSTLISSWLEAVDTPGRGFPSTSLTVMSFAEEKTSKGWKETCQHLGWDQCESDDEENADDTHSRLNDIRLCGECHGAENPCGS